MSFFSEILESLSEAWESVRETFTENSVDSPVETCPLQNNEKAVSEKAMKRLQAAQEAINYTKGVFSHGAGNQIEALNSSKFNSYFRMKAARNNKAFNIPEEVVILAQNNPEAFVAAKAELSKGGNCGEHAYVVYDYLRRKYPDEHIQIAQQEGFDHAFVIIGDPSKEGDNELVVADAWPTDPTPVLWEDHFAYTSDKKKLLNHASSNGDSRDYKQEMFDAGLSFNDEGTKLTENSYDQKKTDEEIKSGKGKWIWEHPDTAADTKYDYVTSRPLPDCGVNE